MKLLNEKDITRAYWRFLGHFLLLLGILVLAAFMFIQTAAKQLALLRADQVQYQKALFTQQAMAQKADLLYQDLRTLNPKLVGSPASLEARIVRENEELKAELVAKLFERRPHEVYRKLTRYVDELLLLKASIREVDAQIKDKQQELEECISTHKKK
ncbi:type VI secretion system TssO [Hymenobacter sp. GOD-10R]|uniref:type VI secretion system TssO n=1 Tax=Hymenobacter sp. GOD-10R TaxID=3093922 RepID=UPI002D789BB7|nr:type VI secretion system TssO [Hymenobacter sp. GOD-10R]WRQ31273.1 type VI secretion system TssO [Hymenobacter sp. GOD-10R]